MKILIVEDDKKISRLLELELKHEGFETEKVEDGYDALISAEEFKPHVVLLDIMIPGINGKEAAKRLRDKYPGMGIIMLTALGEVKDKVEAFSYGADDYVVKPFNIEELLARIGAVSRRRVIAPADNIECGEIEIHPGEHRVFCKGEEINLSKTEYSLLYMFMRNPGQVFTKERILELVWDDYEDKSENLVEVYINYLRKKLGKKGKLIKTIRGVGYSLRDD